jgi:ribosomal protein S8
LTGVTLGSSQTPHPLAFRDAPAPAKILVAKLKYRGDRSVIGKLQLISKPSKNIVMDNEELDRLLRGRRVKGVQGACLGEVFIVKTGSDTYMEGREAVRLGLGGEVMIKVGAQ